jgi:hypothetical protein
MVALTVREAEHAEEVWTALCDSGYAQEWVPGGLLGRAHQDFVAHQNPDTRINEVAVIDGLVVGTAGAVREAEGWWLLHHLGRHPLRGDPNIALDLVRSIMLSAARRGAHHFRFYAERYASHSRRMFYGFARKFGHTGSVYRERMVYRCRTDSDGPTRGEIPALLAVRVGERGANIAGFGDRCHFATPWRTDAERLEMLEQATAFYRGAGVPYFTFVDVYDDKPVPAGYEQLGPAIEWEFDLQTMGAWLDYLRGLRR